MVILWRSPEISFPLVNPVPGLNELITGLSYEYFTVDVAGCLPTTTLTSRLAPSPSATMQENKL